MTRTALTSSNRGETSGVIVRQTLFVKIPFPSGTLLINSSDVSLPFGGDTYLPGVIGGVEGIAENITGSEEMPILHLSGVDSSLITKATTDAVYRLQVTIAEGYRTEANALVDTPEIIFKGFLNYPALIFNDTSGALDINLMTLNSIMRRISRTRACNADQQARFPTDLAFNEVAVNGVRKVMFGNSQAPVGRPGPGMGDSSGHAVTPDHPSFGQSPVPFLPLDPNTVMQ